LFIRLLVHSFFCVWFFNGCLIIGSTDLKEWTWRWQKRRKKQRRWPLCSGTALPVQRVDLLVAGVPLLLETVVLGMVVAVAVPKVV